MNAAIFAKGKREANSRLSLPWNYMQGIMISVEN